MKKNLTIIISLIFFIAISSFNQKLKSQSLKNTTWNFFDANNSPLVTGVFGNDTLFFAAPTPTAIAIFTDTLGTFSVTDIDTSQCGTATGSYSYSITSGTADTLRFTIVNEPCQIRGAFFSPNYGIRLLTSIGESQFSTLEVKVYPNPSFGEFQFEVPSNMVGSQAIIRDLSGREIENFRFSSTDQQIQIDAPKGMYLLQINKYGVKPIIKKLIIQ